MKNHRTFFSKLNNRAFTMIETVIVMGIILLLMTLGMMSLGRVQQSSSLSSVVETFKSDLKNQQIKAMQGDTESGTTPDDYGIHFETNSYSLFRGATYSADLNPYIVNLPKTVEITNFFPNNQVLFMKGLGEVAGCCSGAGFKVTFNDTSANIQKTINLNRLGAYTVD